MSAARDNHYVPQWYQRGFLITPSNQLHYLDLNPDKNHLSDGRIINVNEYRLLPPSKCFFQRDLYTTFFGQHINDEVERKLFGKIDTSGAKAIRAFMSNDVSEWHRNFLNLFPYLDAQKIRTPKGLDWIKSHYPNLSQVELMVEMQAVRNDLPTLFRTVFNNEKSKLCPRIKKTITL